MTGINRDAVVACVLLIFCGAFFAASFDIEDPGYVSLSADIWPRVILAPLTVLCLVYLVQSVRKASAREAAPPRRTLGEWVSDNRNPLWCFVLFGAFLVTLRWLGMLIGGVLFVFLLLTAIGERSPKRILVHTVVAIGSVGAMWAIFTFALRVILPQGVLFSTL